MLKKNCIVILIVIIAAAVIGYYAYINLFSNSPEVPPSSVHKGKVVILLEDIKESTGISFSEIKPAEFSWIDETLSETTIKGKGFEAKNIADNELEKIVSFMEAEFFLESSHNTVLEEGKTGYQAGSVACLIMSRAAEDKYDAEVKCGELE